jgi:single-strand DNA-binding protein
MTKNPELRTNGDTTVTRFSIAVDRRFKKDEADFISCVAFGKTAEFIDKYFSKGNRIGITGEWRTGSYTNKDGQKVYTNDCVVSTAEFVESKKESAPAQNDDFMNIPDDIDSVVPFT